MIIADDISDDKVCIRLDALALVEYVGISFLLTTLLGLDHLENRRKSLVRIDSGHMWHRMVIIPDRDQDERREILTG